MRKIGCENPDLLIKKMTSLRTKCKRCGCTRSIDSKTTKLVCKNCGYYIFIDEKEEFKYRLKEKLYERSDK